MSTSGTIPVGLPVRHRIGHWVALSVCTLLLTLALIRPPVAVDVDDATTHQVLLYETIRLGHQWGEAFITTDGPLAAVQAPGYVSGSVWMAMGWQIGGNLLLAAVLTGLAFRLPWPRRWWALGLLAGILARFPLLAPWVVMMLLGHELIRRWEREPRQVIPFAALLGLLGLSSAGHLLLGLAVLLILALTARPPAAKLAAGGAFLAAFLTGWLVLGQSLPALGHWLVRAFPVVWETSPFWRTTELESFGPWAIATLLGLAVLLAPAMRQRDARAGAVFLLVAALLAWKAMALQPFGLVTVFFGTVLAVALLQLHQGARLGWVLLTAAIAAAGLIRFNPLLLTDALGHFNRQAVKNVRLLASLPRLRAELHELVKANRGARALPRIAAAVGREPVDVLGISPSWAILNGLNVRLRPAPLPGLVRSAVLAELNAAALTGSAAPAFVLQRLQASTDLTPALVDAPAQLALYQGYDFQLEENGFMLWRKKNVTSVAERSLVASGELTWNEVLAVPADGRTHSLELEMAPNLAGRVWSLLDEIAPPGLRVHDGDGIEGTYALAPSVARAGFLIEPFVHGEIDLDRRQSGAAVPRTIGIALVPPPAGSLLWPARFRYRLFTAPNANLTGRILRPDLLDRYRLLSRLPAGVAHNFPFQASVNGEGEALLLAHPDSLVEFTLTGRERRVRGAFAIIRGAYEGAGATDGVDFSVEFIGDDGAREVLFHRSLAPLFEPADRGTQLFDVAIPAARGGRLFLRTYNPPGRGHAWDWSYWREIVIE